MKYTIKKKKSSCEVIMEFDDSDMKRAKNETVKTLSNKIKVDGFRKGHLSDQILIKQLGEEQFLNEIKNTALELFYAEVVRNEDIYPITAPKVEEISDSPLIFKLNIDLYPDVKLGKIEDIKVKKNEIKIDDKEIDDAIEEIKKYNLKYKTSNSAAKKNDKVEIDFEGFHQNGDIIPEAKSLNHPMIIGQNMFIPGFEDKLIGMKLNEDKEFDIKFPENYRSNELKGKKIKFKVKMKRIEEPIEIVIDDKFASEISGGQAKNVKDLKKMIADSIKQKKEQEELNNYKNKVIEEFTKKIDVEIPDSLITNETYFLYEQFLKNLEEKKITLDKYLEVKKQTKEQLLNNFKKEAEIRLKINMGLKQLIKEKDIKLTDKEQKKILENIDNTQKKEQILSEALFNKALEYLYKLADK